MKICCVLVMLLISACHDSSQKEKEISLYGNPIGMKSDSIYSPKDELILDVFSSVPDTIDGCGDYYSYDSTQFKSDRYIFLSRMGEIAVVLLNGKQVYLKNIPELSVSDDKSIHEEFLSEGIKAFLDLQLIRQYEEGGFFSGTLTIIWKSNRTVFKIYGQTGC